MITRKTARPLTILLSRVSIFGIFAGIAFLVIPELVGLVFAIYLLSGKEKLKRQACRLIRVWLPQNMGES